MTWGEFSYSVSGYFDREREDWKKFRLIAMMQYNTHSKRPIRDPELFMRLEPIKKSPIKPNTMTRETWERVKQEITDGRR